MQPKSLLRLPAGGVEARGSRERAASSRSSTIRRSASGATRSAPRVLHRQDVLRSRGEGAAGERGDRRASRSCIRGRPSRSRAIVDLYPNVVEVVWAQEEPKNMGAWSYVAPRLRASTGNAMLIRYIGRPERASPAEGYLTSHQAEQARIVADALEVPRRSERRRRGRNDRSPHPEERIMRIRRLRRVARCARRRRRCSLCVADRAAWRAGARRRCVGRGDRGPVGTNARARHRRASGRRGHAAHHVAARVAGTSRRRTSRSRAATAVRTCSATSSAKR